jgi:hypothetical protein
MDQEECYAWGELFARPAEERRAGMSGRAERMGLRQRDEDGTLVWSRDDREACRWIFLGDPSDIERVRAIYADDRNVRSPSCYVVVDQPDPFETRGDRIFDIFRLSPASHLWHFHRVYTRPAGSTGEP